MEVGQEIFIFTHELTTRMIWNDHYIENMTDEIFTRTVGEGDKILLMIHAFPANSQMFAKLSNFLPDGWMAIFPDLPGFGQSPQIEEQEVMTMAELGEIALSVLPEDYSKLVIGGVSMGGYITMAIIRQSDDIADGYILANTRDSADDDGGQGREEVVQQIHSGERDEYISELLPKLLGEDNLTDETIVNEVKSIISSTADLAIIQTSKGMGKRPSSRKHLEDVESPILLITGNQDSITGVEVMDEMNDHYQNSSLSIIDSAGHYAVIEQPYQVSLAIKNFLKSIE